MTDQTLARAIAEHLQSLGKKLSTDPLDSVIIPCQNGERVEIPVLFLQDIIGPCHAQEKPE